MKISSTQVIRTPGAEEEKSCSLADPSILSDDEMIYEVTLWLELNITFVSMKQS